MQANGSPDPDQALLDMVRLDIEQTLQQASLNRIVQDNQAGLLGGKMLRARLILAIGKAIDTDTTRLISACAAVELLHAASLLHDDVVDGGRLRRGAPALWVTQGPKVAVLLGDILLSIVFTKISESQPTAIPALARTLAAMCQAEVEQELLIQKATGTWEDCVRIAAGKTGSLFGFAASCAAPDHSELSQHLMQAGKKLGIAYQIADDLLDLQTDRKDADKTPGTDAEANKLTAARFVAQRPETPEHIIEQWIRDASHALRRWPKVQAAWHDYQKQHLQPILGHVTTTRKNQNEPAIAP